MPSKSDVHPGTSPSRGGGWGVGGGVCGGLGPGPGHTEAFGSQAEQRLPGECGTGRVPGEGRRRRTPSGAERARVAGWHGLAAG